jgi:hypothetical protein
LRKGEAVAAEVAVAVAVAVREELVARVVRVPAGRQQGHPQAAAERLALPELVRPALALRA